MDIDAPEDSQPKFYLGVFGFSFCLTGGERLTLTQMPQAIEGREILR